MVRILFSCIFLCGMVVAGCTDSADQKNLEPRIIPTQPATEDRVPGQYLVTLKEGVSTETLNDVFGQYEIKSIKDLAKNRYLITLQQDPGPEEITKQADTSSEIRYVQPNYIYRTMPPEQDKSQQVR